MADESLTTEEMDTLLEGVSAEEAERAAAAGGPGDEDGAGSGAARASGVDGAAGVRAYDLGTGGPSPLRLPMLEALNERIARELREQLEDLLDRPVELSVRPVEQMSFGAFAAETGEPTNANLMEVGGLGGQALLVCDPSWIIGMTDLLFGGRGQSGDLAGREFSATERRIVQRLLQVFVEVCERAWSPWVALAMRPVRSELSPRFTVIAAPRAMVLVTTFDVRAGEAAGRILLCLPAAIIEPVRKGLGATEPESARPPSPRWQHHMARQIQTAEVGVTAEFAQAQATVADLLRLKRGDFIELDLKPTATVLVDDIPFFECRYGISNKRYAVRIQSFLAARDEAASGEQP
jgi:flagellar motor switch protein FliM